MSDDWDRLCKARRALPTADELAARDERIGDLKAALDDVLGEVAWLSRRVAETEEALAPFAKLEAQATLPDDAWTSQYVRLADVRRARRVLGAGAVAAVLGERGEGDK